MNPLRIPSKVAQNREMSQFQPGQKKPHGSGRKKGGKNKSSKYLADILESADFNVVEKLIEILPSLPKEKQADILVDLMSFLHPKRKATEILQTEVKAEPQKMEIVFVSATGKRMSADQTQYGWDDKDY
jgi:hypothetical protein